MAKDPEKALDTPKSYRVVRTEAFIWQAYVTTQNSDGTFSEEPIYKPDVFEIVMNKISQAVRHEGQVNFLAQKKIKSVAK